MKKKILSLVLALALVCALLPTAALAADNDFVIWGGVLADYVGPGGDVVIPYGVTTIGKHAFPKCTELTDPNGNPAGSRYDPPDYKMTSVTIPNSVIAIEEWAFMSCKDLTSVTIPDSVTFIGPYAFHYCTSVTSLTIPDGVTTIGDYAFAGCKSLTSVTIPDSVVAIGRGAFSGCTNLTSVTLPRRLTNIEDWVFEFCPNVTFQYYPSQRQWETINVDSVWSYNKIPTAPAPHSTATVTQVVPYKYDKVGDFNDGMAVVWLNDECGVIDTTGNEIVPRATSVFDNYKYVDDAFYNGRLLVGRSSYVESAYVSVNALRCEFGFVDINGKMVIPFGGSRDYYPSAVMSERDAVKSTMVKYRFHDGVSSLLGGLIDPNGNVLVPSEKYQSINDFSEGLAAVKQDNKWGFIDTTGREVVPCKYDKVEDFSNGLARVNIGGKDEWKGSRSQFEGGLWGYIDATGREVIPCKYKDARNFTDGKAAVFDRTDQVANGQTVYAWGMIDTAGNLVVPIGQYNVEKDADRFGYHQGLKATQISNKWGFVDKAGNPVGPARYDKTSDFSNGLAAVYISDQGWGYIDLQGNEVLPCQYSSAREFRDGMVAVDLDGKWGFVRIEGLPTESQSTQTTPTVTPAPTEAPVPTVPTAYASTQTVQVDGKPVTFNAYALKDANGNDTNYIKLRDVADVLNGSAAQFQVGWDGSIAITTNAAYTPNGTEMVQNFSGNQSYTVSTSPVTVNGVATNLEAITLTDASGGGYTYFKLRDLGAALGFNVSWDAQTGITIDPNTPYNPNN